MLHVNLGGHSVAVVIAVVCTAFLKAGELLLIFAVRVEVRAVLGITVSIAGGAQAEAVVVDHHRAEDNLVAAVPVHITYGEVVVTVAEPRAGAIVRLPIPLAGQLVGLWIHFVCGKLMFRIAATAKEDARVTAVDERSAEIMLGGAVAYDTLTPV